MSTTNILLTEEQRELAQMAAKIVKAELAPRVAELDQSGEFPLDVMESLRGAGFYGMGIPEKYGGLGLDLTTQMAIYEEIAKVDAGFSFNFALASIAQSAMDIALDYAKVRKTFGKPIIEHQGMAFLLADMQKRVDAARAMLYYSAAALDQGLPIGTLSPSTKIFVSETAMSVTTDAVQVLGGYGYMKEYPVEKLMRDAKVFSIFEGTNQINLMVSSGMLARQKSGQ